MPGKQALLLSCGPSGVLMKIQRYLHSPFNMAGLQPPTNSVFSGVSACLSIWSSFSVPVDVFPPRSLGILPHVYTVLESAKALSHYVYVWSRSLLCGHSKLLQFPSALKAPCSRAWLLRTKIVAFFLATTRMKKWPQGKQQGLYRSLFSKDLYTTHNLNRKGLI